MYVPIEEPLVLRPIWQSPLGGTRILVIDPNPTAGSSMCESLKDVNYQATLLTSPNEVWSLFAVEDFDLVFINVDTPGMGGFELLKQFLKTKPHLPIVLTSDSPSTEMMRHAIIEGASDFIVNNHSYSELAIVVERNLIRQSLKHRKEIDHKMEIQRTQRGLLETLLGIIDTRDPETEGHSERVAAFTMVLAQQMKLGIDELINIERGALLHDIGKIGVSDSILYKPGALNDDEWALMKEHPLIGYRMCARFEALHQAANIVLHHHERYDGTGYPHKLKGDEIPLGARIFAVADAFDAITSFRPYRPAAPMEYASEEICRNSGSQFDPQIIEVFSAIPLATWQEVRSLVNQDYLIDKAA